MASDHTFIVTETTQYVVYAKDSKAAVAKVVKGKVNQDDVDAYYVSVD